jgi:hypothetical protein
MKAKFTDLAMNVILSHAYLTRWFLHSHELNLVDHYAARAFR